MLVEHVVRLCLLLLAPQPLDLGAHLGQLGAVQLLLLGDLALILLRLIVAASSECVGLAGFGLQPFLELCGLFPLARLLLL